jgi:hypothetical protein
MPKGEKIKAKAINGSATTWEMDQLPLERFWFVKTLLLSLLSKVGFLWGEVLIMKKGGVFESFIKFLWNTSLYVSTSGLDLVIGIWVWFAKKNKPSGGKGWSIYVKIESKQFEFLFEVVLYLFHLLYIVLA